MDDLKRLLKLAKKQNIEVTVKPNNHVQIHGNLMVNYYPLSKRRTAYVKGTTKGTEHVTPEKALEMAMTQPKITQTPAKRKTGNIAKKVRLYAKDHHCHWCRKELSLNPKDENYATIEHIVPLKRGGLDNMNNMTLACKKCNHERGHNMPELRLVK